MGNQLEKDYTISEKPFATGGPMSLWRIHTGTHRQTREEVSVFCCSFKDIETVYGKNNVQQVINHFKMESQTLQKLRHPLILSPQQQFFETKTQLAMITEPVLGSVSNLLFKNYTHIPEVLPMMKNFNLSKLEIKYGMCQVMEALTFCHQNAKLTHAGLHPHNIYITVDGHWKISGFQFSFYSQGAPTSEGGNTTPTLFRRNFSKRDFLPSLDFTAPEYVLEQSPGYASDIFSFALIYLQLIMEKQYSILETEQDINAYTNSVSRLNEVVRNLRVSQEIRESLLTSCSIKPQERPTSHFLLSNCELLFGNEVKALRYLANMEMREPVKKAQFLSSLTPMLKAPKPHQLVNGVEDTSTEEGFSNSIIFSKVLPPLLKECTDVKMLLYALPNVLALSERMTTKEFSKQVMPTLSKVALVQASNVKIPLKLLENFNLMWDKTTDDDHMKELTPFLIRCLDSKFPDVQNEALKRCEECLNSERISYPEFKSTLLPQIEIICHNTTNQSVSLAPLFAADRSGAQLSAALLMTCVGVYLKISKHLQKIDDPSLGKIIATRIIPSISPIAMQTSLNVEQFTKYMKAMKSMIEMMENIRYEEFRENDPEANIPDSSVTAFSQQPVSTFSQPPSSASSFTSTLTPTSSFHSTENPIQKILKEPVPVIDQKSYFLDDEEKEKLLRQKEEEERLRQEEEEKQRAFLENQKLFDALMNKHWSDIPESPKKLPSPKLKTTADIDFDRLQQKMISSGLDDEEVSLPQKVIKSPSPVLDTSNVTAPSITKTPSPKTNIIETTFPTKAVGGFDEMLSRFDAGSDDEEEIPPRKLTPSSSGLNSTTVGSSQPISTTVSSQLPSFDDDLSPVMQSMESRATVFSSRKPILPAIGETRDPTDDFDSLLAQHMSDDEE
ncbi:hypothetical protein C9374_002654 [Naegleria lovaniensis]|uniref:Protein kinase domain-containing protein n=1 Tax=Naegleria lovaniensis TaxID=51637 RepID=A0AA88GTW7_NAELO|nr:uncharacterized protein C9374_002654 [Naegleria lovaniensis]KAG2386208.1 hypothetical protein C9374_002654 [Naegleria lovaniensis]